MNTYTKLQTGDWGVLCDSRPNVGDVVTVTKKNKTTKQETIAQVWTRRTASGDKFACAIATERGGKCENLDCGRYCNHRTKRYDMSGIGGMVCDRCAGLGKTDIQFG